MATTTGTASAVPNNLYDYAKQTTQANDATKIQATKLSDAIVAYYQGAIDFGNNINGVTANGTSDISYEILQTLPGIRTTDQKVHDIGAAFELVNKQTMTVDDGVSSGDPDPYASALATTGDEKQLDANLAKVEQEEAQAAQAQAGIDLANYANLHGIDQYVLAELETNAGDPYFVTQFYNNLHHDKLDILIHKFGDSADPSLTWGRDFSAIIVNSLVTAYGTGMLRPYLSQWITNDAALRGLYSFYSKFTASLESNRSAALNYVSNINNDTYLENDPVLAPELLKVAIVAESATPDPITVKHIWDVIINGLSNDPNAPGPPQLLRYLSVLAGLTEQNLLAGNPPPNSTNASDQRDWAQLYGDQIASVMVPLLNWVKDRDNNDASFHNDEQTIFWDSVGILAGVAVTVLLPELLPAAGIVTSASVGTAISVGVDVASWFNSHMQSLADAQGDSMTAATITCAEMWITRTYLQRNMLVPIYSGNLQPRPANDLGNLGKHWPVKTSADLTYVIDHKDSFGIVVNGQPALQSLANMLDAVDASVGKDAVKMANPTPPPATPLPAPTPTPTPTPTPYPVPTVGPNTPAEPGKG